MALSNREIQMIREAVQLLTEADDDDSASGANTRRGATGEFKIGAYCAGAKPIKDKKTYEAAVKLIKTKIKQCPQVLDNATTKANTMIGSKSAGFMYFESGTTDAQANKAGHTEKKKKLKGGDVKIPAADDYKKKIDGIDEDARQVAEMMIAWYNEKIKNKGQKKYIPAKLLRFDVADNSDQGDIYVKIPKDKEYPWSLKVQGSPAGQQNLGASALSDKEGVVKWDFKDTVKDALLSWFKSLGDTDIKGLKEGAQVKKKLKLKGTAKNYLLNDDGEITAIDYKYWGKNNLTGVVGKALSVGLIENALTVKGLTMIKDAVVENSGVGQEKGDKTMIGSPSAYKDWKAKKGYTNTSDLFPGLANIVKNNTKFTENKILIHRSKNKSEKATLHIGYGSAAQCDKVASGRLWSMSLRKTSRSGGFDASIGFNVKPPSRKQEHTYKTVAVMKTEILAEGMDIVSTVRQVLLLEDESQWDEYQLDPTAAEEMHDDAVDIFDPMEIGEYFLDNGTVDDLGIEFEDDQDFDLSQEEQVAACKVAANACDGAPIGDESYEADESYHEADETLAENRWMKLAGLLKD